jgi:short-subunit dehydrogenase
MSANLLARWFGPLNTPQQDWHGQRIWLIGASSGIGAALAQALLARGARVALSARRCERLLAVAGGHAHAVPLPFDVADQNAWGSAHQTLKQQWGGVDLIIFCAANYQPERIWQVEPQQAQQTLMVNLHSVYQGLYVCLPDLIKNGAGGVAIIASVAGFVGLPNASVYGPSKAALINLAEILYGDLHPKGINVYLINPGFVSTELTAKNTFFMPALQTPEQAALAILHGMQRGRFEIHFPRRFTAILKLLQFLPYRLRFALFSRLLDSNDRVAATHPVPIDGGGAT